MKITINNVQHLKRQEFELDLSQNKIFCVAGKNGVGKTTLVRAIRNLSIHNTFQETAAPYIFSKDSSIVYSFGDLFSDIEFKYNKFLKVVDSRQEIPEEVKSRISVELPIPHGERFKHFRSLADKDDSIRANIANGDYQLATDLSVFLSRIYKDSDFSRLYQTEVKGVLYYFFLKDDSERFYIREDYLSSGEYFVINLFKRINSGCKLIVIDEVDISLDASAQVNLVGALRSYCETHEVNILFTTHSLALMKTLHSDELIYMENQDGVVSCKSRSYGFIKSVMYGFSGFDKYILTEDKCLAKYIEYLINDSGQESFFKYQVIYVGGATQVIDLMKRNNDLGFLSSGDNVLVVLDGDQKDKGYIKGLSNVVLLPFDNIEIEIFSAYENGTLVFHGLKEIKNKKRADKAKSLYRQITAIDRETNRAMMPDISIYNYLDSINKDGVFEFRSSLKKFVSTN